MRISTLQVSSCFCVCVWLAQTEPVIHRRAPAPTTLPVEAAEYAAIDREAMIEEEEDVHVDEVCRVRMFTCVCV